MGNTLPISSPPRPSPHRAVIFMEPQPVRSYLREPWRRPAGKLQIMDDAGELPPALDGAIPPDEYERMIQAVSDRAATYKGGMIHIAVALFQTCLILAVLLGYFFSKYTDDQGEGGGAFFNPITLGLVGALELGVLSWSARYFQREELRLKIDLLELIHPWRGQYGVVAKLRKTRGNIIGDEDGGGEGKKSSTYYCLILEKMGPEDDLDTASLSTFTDMESDVESQA